MRRTEWNGGPFQAAIDFACQDGDLHRWKRQYGGMVALPKQELPLPYV